MENTRKTRYPLLTVVMPTYNKGPAIGVFLAEVIHYLSAQDFLSEVVVVDDASKDETWKIVMQLSSKQETSGWAGKLPLTPLRNRCNQGKGHSLKKGVMASRGRFILTMDGDNAYHISDLKHFLNALQSGPFDIAVGNRRLPESRFVLSPTRLPYVYFRHLTGVWFNFVTRKTLLPGFTDTQCGFKCFRRKAAVDIFGRQRIKGFCFDVEVLYLAQELGYRCADVPVTFYYDGEPSSVRLFPDAFRFLLDLARIHTNMRRGRYGIRK